MRSTSHSLSSSHHRLAPLNTGMEATTASLAGDSTQTSPLRTAGEPTASANLDLNLVSLTNLAAAAADEGSVTMTTPDANASATAFVHGPFSQQYFDQLSAEELRNYIFQHQLPGEPSSVAAISIICLACLVFVCSSLVLLATRYTSGGQSATLVFLRSLLLSDILMSVYGVSKMAMLLQLRHIRSNFFLPDSLFFTASVASTASLLSLNLDCFLKLTRPLKYAQFHKDTIITVMLFIWNVAFVVGFLPLVGWYQEAYTFRFFSFYPWHFLLFNGLLVLLCALLCLGSMVTLKRFLHAPSSSAASYPALSDPSAEASHRQSPRSDLSVHTRSLEVRKYQHLHRTILVESCMWLAAYLPFFLYISVACRQCVAGHFRYSDAAILYFVPVFLFKSLVSAGLQAFRTLRVHAIMNRLITDISQGLASPSSSSSLAGASQTGNHHHHHHHQDQHLQQHKEARSGRPKVKGKVKGKGRGVATIAYTNPLCLDSIDELREENEYRRYCRYCRDDGLTGVDTADTCSSEDGGGYQYDMAPQRTPSQRPCPYHQNHNQHHHHHDQQQHFYHHHHHHSSTTLLLEHPGWLQSQHALHLHDTELTDMTSLSEAGNGALSRQGSASTITGIANMAFQPGLYQYQDGQLSTKL